MNRKIAALALALASIGFMSNASAHYIYQISDVVPTDFYTGDTPNTVDYSLQIEQKYSVVFDFQLAANTIYTYADAIGKGYGLDFNWVKGDPTSPVQDPVALTLETDGTGAIYKWAIYVRPITPLIPNIYSEMNFSDYGSSNISTLDANGKSILISMGNTITPGDWTSKYADNAFVYSQTPTVPEPETYAMMLAGLGLVGFAARRRK